MVGNFVFRVGRGVLFNYQFMDTKNGEMGGRDLPCRVGGVCVYFADPQLKFGALFGVDSDGTFHFVQRAFGRRDVDGGNFLFL